MVLHPRRSILDKMQEAEEIQAALQELDEEGGLSDDNDDAHDPQVEHRFSASLYENVDDEDEDDDDEYDEDDNDDDVEEDEDDVDEVEDLGGRIDNVVRGDIINRNTSNGSSQLVPLYEESEEAENTSSSNLAAGGNIMGYGYEDQEDHKKPSLDSFLQSSSNQSVKRTSFQAADRRISTESQFSGQTSSSAPARTGRASLSVKVDSEADRRFTVQGQSNNSNDKLGGRGRASRRDRLYGASPSIYGESPTFTDYTDSPGRKAGGGGLIQTLRSRGTFIGRRRTTRSQAGSSKLSDLDNMADIVSKLENHETDFGHVSAAAAVVAASANPNERVLIQFTQGDYVLVVLKLLKMAAHDDDRNQDTVDPVNEHGYPQGEGKTDAEKQGPYLYVLCCVTQVHFEEDARFYTVKRFDNGKEQRAEPKFMLLCNEDAIEAALQAAKRTEHTNEAKPALEQLGPLRVLARCFSNCGFSIMRILIPRYRICRNSTKQFLGHLLHGDHGYAFNIHFSGINFLVVCSLIFLFEDIVTLAFLSADWDRSSAIVGLVAWVVLAMELFLEFLIRPSNYIELLQTDKAFAPSTARHINRYHLVCEAVALILYIPHVACALTGECRDQPFLNSATAPLWAVTSLDVSKAALGRFSLGLTFLRAFGLVRHWKQMWINQTFEGEHHEASFFRRLIVVKERNKFGSPSLFRRKKMDDETSNSVQAEQRALANKHDEKDDDQQLKNAATIGTALMLVNSHRALFFLLLVVSVFPVINYSFISNPVATNQARLLQANNVLSNTTDEVDCEYLKNAVQAWFQSVSALHAPKFNNDGSLSDNAYLQFAQLLPVRCDWQHPEGILTFCGDNATTASIPYCDFWKKASPDDWTRASADYYAEKLDLREGGFTDITYSEIGPASFFDGEFTAEFFIRVIYNESESVALAHLALFLLLSSMILLGLFGLTVMRADAERLVLFPLQRMLRIIVRYAENPLSTQASRADSRASRRITGSNGRNDANGDDPDSQLGHYETEQLINAIAKIADLLRKCWGVAGAGIISSNLARTKDGRTVVFNPTVAGKQVYALFGFVAINDFSKQLRALDNDVMILINDVARIIHDEVYRWALGDSGQCNKNLGGAFLMVFRIGDFSEVHDKKKRATDVVFNSQMKNVKVRQRQKSGRKGRASSRHFDLGSGGTLQLASLPGIQAFTDRALLGFLKSYAGLHRDQQLLKWQNDFRLGQGVGNFTISVIYGMDAGWAVEGAVGSEYKIDATYLSPHVNMASRMMSACKQYGVTFLLSQAVEELLSKPARSKLRHLDTVNVKGSKVDQRIYTYDARHQGVDFFLFERPPDQADIEAEAYTTAVWENDQDLKSMRQHVTDEFMTTFHKGVELYLEGKWKAAVKILKDADNLMFEAVLEQGFVDYITEDLGEYGKSTKLPNDEITRLKNEFGDGACKCLIQYMERRDCQPPSDWKGVRALMSK